MLIISERYNSIQSLACKCKFYETKDSDNFEKSCARYLRKQFPDHTFIVKGGNNKTISDILVDDKFYIECKMTESNNKSCVAQSTGFGIKLVDDGNGNLKASGITIQNIVDNMIPYTTEEVQGILDEVFN